MFGRPLSGLMQRSATVVPRLTVLAGGDITMGAGGQIFIDDGSLANPGLAFRSDVDTGLAIVSGSLRYVFGATNLMTATASSLAPQVPVSFGNYMAVAVTTGITASTTQTQGQQPLTVGRNFHTVDTVANANDVVTMPSAVAGQAVFLANRGANTLQIFPASGDNFQGSAVDASITLAAAAEGIYIPADTTVWVRILN